MGLDGGETGKITFEDETGTTIESNGGLVLMAKEGIRLESMTGIVMQGMSDIMALYSEGASSLCVNGSVDMLGMRTGLAGTVYQAVSYTHLIQLLGQGNTAGALFSGYPEKVEIKEERGYRIADIQAVSGTILLDQKKSNRVFQKKAQTYMGIANTITADTEHSACISVSYTHLMFITPLEGKLLYGSFNCILGMQDEWEEIAMYCIRTITKVEEEQQ